MKQRLAQISLLVRDYDEAIQYYTNTLKLVLVEDTRLSDTKRWVRVAAPGDSSFTLLLAKADGEQQQAFVGNQTGGRVFLFLYTDDFWRDYNDMTKKGVHFLREPATAPYGTVAVFEDLYGNLWDFIEPGSQT
jgi:catechol 2,3-dioxygenase-like lactoylglutathione lyase family enzyme